MDRRKALRNIGLSAGFMAASPGLLSILQSCTTDQNTWVPQTLTPQQGAVLRGVVDVILPKSDTPSASEVNVPEFIDKFVGSAMTIDEQKLFIFSLDGLVGNLKSEYGNVEKISTEEYEAYLTKHLREAAKNEETHNEAITSYSEAIKNGEPVVGDPAALSYSSLAKIREMAVFAYKNSEMVGEQVLPYLPVPGGYTGCGSLEELTGGKAWSL